MDEQTINALKKAEAPQWVSGLNEKLKSMIKLSRDKMDEYYFRWEDIDEMFQVKAPQPNDSDKMASERDEPTRMTLPFLHSQMHTFTAIGESLLGERPAFFELSGVGAEDVLPSLLGQSLLDRDLEKFDFKHVGLKQYLTNAVRYDVAPLKWSWHEEKEWIEEEVPVEGAEAFGSTETVSSETVTFQGNKIWNVSPYRFLPDPRVPVYKIQDGEFCGDDMYYSRVELQEMEGHGDLAGVVHIPNLNQQDLAQTRNPFGKAVDLDFNTLKDRVLVTELQFRLIPKDLTKEDPQMEGHKLGDEDYPVTFVAWIANNRIIKLDRSGYQEVNFTYSCGVLNPDEENFIGLGIANILKPIQETADWFINSRIESLRNTIDKQVYADPSAINVADITNRSKVVRLKKNAQGTDIRRYLYEPNVSDASTTNVTDAQLLYSFAKEGTGLTDNLVGQFSSGRRSAKEASNVHANAVQRIKSDIKTLWHTGLKPMGQAMLCNHRQGLDVDQLVRIVGVTDYHKEMLGVIQQFFAIDKQQLMGKYDFTFQDALLPSENQQIAATLQELLDKTLQNPQMFQMILAAGFNPLKMLEELLQRIGLKNVNRFRATQDELVRLSQFMQVAGLQAFTPPTEGAAGPQAQGTPQPALPNGTNPTGAPAGVQGASNSGGFSF